MSKAKRGYSLVEVVVAMAVITTVTMTALSIMLFSISSRKTASDKAMAQNFAENAWECFKASESREEFVSCLVFAEDVSLADGEEDAEGRTVYRYEFEECRYTATIKIQYSDTARSTFSVDVTDDDGDEIVSFTYRKGDGA